MSTRPTNSSIAFPSTGSPYETQSGAAQSSQSSQLNQDRLSSLLQGVREQAENTSAFQHNSSSLPSSSPHLGTGSGNFEREPQKDLSLFSREHAPDKGGVLTNSHFTSVKIPDANGEVREYWVWATTKLKVEGKDCTFHSAILEGDVEPLKNSLQPILEEALNKEGKLKNAPQIDITLKTIRDAVANRTTNTVTLTAHNDSSVKAEVTDSQNSKLTVSLNAYQQLISKISNPNRPAVDSNGRPVTTLRPGEEFNAAINRASGSPSTSSAASGANQTASAQGNSSTNATGSASRDDLESNLKKPNTLLSNEHLIEGLRLIKYHKGKEQCPVELKLGSKTLEADNSSSVIDTVFTTDDPKDARTIAAGNSPLAAATITEAERKKPVFIPIFSQNHYVYLCIEGDTAYYYDPKGRSIGNINSSLSNGRVFGTGLTEELGRLSKKGTNREKEIALFCLKYRIREFKPYVAKEVEAHQRPNDNHNCGPFGLAWYEHLCEEFSKNIVKRTFFGIKPFGDFGDTTDIEQFRINFCSSGRYPKATESTPPTATTTTSQPNGNGSSPQNAPSPSAAPSTTTNGTTIPQSSTATPGDATTSTTPPVAGAPSIAGPFTNNQQKLGDFDKIAWINTIADRASFLNALSEHIQKETNESDTAIETALGGLSLNLGANHSKLAQRLLNCMEPSDRFLPDVKRIISDISNKPDLYHHFRKPSHLP